MGHMGFQRGSLQSCDAHSGSQTLCAMGDCSQGEESTIVIISLVRSNK